MGLDEVRKLKEQAGQPRIKKVYQIPKRSKKRIEQDKLQRKVVFVKPTKDSYDGSKTNRTELDEVALFPNTDEMDRFWKHAERVIAKNPKCWECGDFIAKADYRASTGHIFPKSPNSGFPSVASNEWNFVVVGNRCGCHNKTHRLDTFSQMKVFPVAVQRFLRFHHLITEKRKYLDLFIDYANATI